MATSLIIYEKNENDELNAKIRVELLKELTGEVMITPQSATWREIKNSLIGVKKSKSVYISLGQAFWKIQIIKNIHNLVTYLL